MRGSLSNDIRLRSIKASNSANRVERGRAAYRLTEERHPLDIDDLQRRQVAQRGIGVERLIHKGAAVATAIHPAWPKSINRQGHVPPPSRSAIATEWLEMPPQPCSTMTPG